MGDDGGEEGQIFVNIVVSKLWSEPRIITSLERKQCAGVLKITVKEAKGLRIADAGRFGGGKSDPFCVVEVSFMVDVHLSLSLTHTHTQIKKSYAPLSSIVAITLKSLSLSLSLSQTTNLSGM